MKVWKQALLAGLVLGGSAALGAEPALAPGGKTLVVPGKAKALGTVYYANPGREVQLNFATDGGGDRLVGRSNAVVGYAILGTSEQPAKLQGGEWLLPVAELKTGDAAKDAALHGPGCLDAAKHPNATFVLKEVADIAPVEATEIARSLSQKLAKATIKGELTVRGVTKAVEWRDAQIRTMPGNANTALAFSGDLLTVRVKASIDLSAFGASGEGATGTKVAEKIDVTLNLGMYSDPPEKQPAGRTRPEGKQDGEGQKGEESKPKSVKPEMILPPPK